MIDAGQIIQIEEGILTQPQLLMEAKVIFPDHIAAIQLSPAGAKGHRFYRIEIRHQPMVDRIQGHGAYSISAHRFVQRRYSFRSNIGVVQQDVYLFSGTIRENILYGRLDASEEEVIEAAKKAEAHEFILNLKDGYDTYVGERGVKLSGGQKQRISIARVFLKNPAILILDEATSALDNDSEAAIVKSLDKLSEGRTTLTIAHRLSSIQNSDRVLELTDDGIREKNEILINR